MFGIRNIYHYGSMEFPGITIDANSEATATTAHPDKNTMSVLAFEVLSIIIHVIVAVASLFASMVIPGNSIDPQ